MNTNNTVYGVIDREFEECVNTFPDQLLEITGISKNKINVDKTLDILKNDEYSTIADVSTDPNANVGETSYATILQECHKGILKYHALKNLFRKAYIEYGRETAIRILKEEIEGTLYLSDLHLFDAPYCYNFSVNWLMNKGLPFIPRIPSAPAKHIDTFLQHAAQLITYASNHQSGACGLTGFFVACDYYLRKDGITSRKQINQMFQEFTYTMNQPFRFSAQTPFLNLALFDRYYTESLYGDITYPDGSKIDIESVIKLEKIYGEWIVSEMENKGIIFTFPVTSVSILLDEETRTPKDTEMFDWACNINAKFGLFNFYYSTNAGAISSCCRLSNDINALQELGYMNSFGAGGDGVGSTGVVTINLPHVFMTAKADRKCIREVLDTAIRDAQKCAYIRKELVRENIKRGHLPLYTHGFIDINSQYCTIGICGMYEAAKAAGVITGTLNKNNIEDYQNFAIKILNRINTLNLEAGKTYDSPFNLEQVPAEGQAVTLATKDRVQGLQNDFVLYSNQWIPLSESNVDVFTRIRLAGLLDRVCSGGAILHITTGTKVSAEVQKRLLLYCAKMGVVYCALNYTLSRCNSCHTVTPGDISNCPECGGTNIDIYTRVVGFVTPVKQWHSTRRDEFYRRKRYGDIDARQKEMMELKTA